jgi:hypothetical protein
VSLHLGQFLLEVPMRRIMLPRPALACGVALAVLLASPARVRSADEGAAVGKCADDKPMLARRVSADKSWRFVKDKDAIHDGDLLVGGGGPTISSANNAVALALTGDMSMTSPFPVIETAVVLHPPGDSDLNFSLERGAVILTNRKQSGAAKVHVTIAGSSGDVILKEPGDKLALEVYGRWLPGSQFHKRPKAGTGPIIGMAVLVIKGEADVKGKTKHFIMKAPPGPALLVADDLNEEAANPRHLDKLPDWADTTESAPEKALKVRLTKLRELATAKSMGEALDEFAQSDDPTLRRTAVLAMGAMDDLPRLGQTLRNTKHLDVWENGIIALRHWIGRGPGQDVELYNRLVEVAKYPPHEAEIFVQLLHGFSEEQMARPETYETLIDYLQSDRLGLRALAHWYLVHMVPQGKKIDYNPLADKAERDKASKEWSQLIPAGKVPPKPKAGEK